MLIGLYSEELLSLLNDATEWIFGYMDCGAQSYSGKQWGMHAI